MKTCQWKPFQIGFFEKNLHCLYIEYIHNQVIVQLNKYLWKNSTMQLITTWPLDSWITVQSGSRSSINLFSFCTLIKIKKSLEVFSAHQYEPWQKPSAPISTHINQQADLIGWWEGPESECKSLLCNYEAIMSKLSPIQELLSSFMKSILSPAPSRNQC